MIFHPTSRTRKVVASMLAVTVVGGGAAGAVAASNGTPARAPAAAAAAAAAPATTSTVPAPLTRAEKAAEDVIGFLEKGQPAKSKSEARVLRDLAHGQAADALRSSGADPAKVRALQQRADRAAKLSLGGAPALQVSQAANSVSRLMPGFHRLYKDPVPPSVLTLDHLDRQVQLDSQAGKQARVRDSLRQLDAVWRQLRPQVVTAGGAAVAAAYDQHLSALHHGGTGAAMQRQAVHGLDVVDQMEAVFLGK